MSVDEEDDDDDDETSKVSDIYFNFFYCKWFLNLVN